MMERDKGFLEFLLKGRQNLKFLRRYSRGEGGIYGVPEDDGYYVCSRDFVIYMKSYLDGGPVFYDWTGHVFHSFPVDYVQRWKDVFRYIMKRAQTDEIRSGLIIPARFFLEEELRKLRSFFFRGYGGTMHLKVEDGKLRVDSIQYGRYIFKITDTLNREFFIGYCNFDRGIRMNFGLFSVLASFVYCDYMLLFKDMLFFIPSFELDLEWAGMKVLVEDE